ncbi:hypothetical protein HALLA_11060 [Halostagnicola larsenii XH-48]|uniref:Uncharacterized protein n=1 Tax=Halostagnicola larsenii XH-48 TaxID=797299 RepID=W0JUA7_9EURY|nr:hypothetical protein HALLA_11060 [Halostagnicola larsenii XH-48]
MQGGRAQRERGRDATAVANGEAVSEHVRPCVQIAPGPLLTASKSASGASRNRRDLK